MNRRICAATLLVLFGLSLSAYAQTESSGSTAAERPTVSSSNALLSRGARASENSAVALLRKRVAEVEWVETPFEEIITWLKDESEGQVNIIPRWEPLGNESVDVDTPVTLELTNATVSEILIEVLNNMSPDGQLGFRAARNTLKISTRADFDRKMLLRIYDMTDILFRVQDFGRNAPAIDLQHTGGSGGGGGGGRSVFSGGTSGTDQGDSGEQAEQEMITRLEDLAEKIQEVIAPETWDTGQGGGRGRIRVFNRSLLVYNTIEVHEEIGGPVELGR